MLNASQPIGIFDSGIGGLTITHHVVKLLPKENIIYFGDTAHLPYGDKSAAVIQSYATRIAHILLEQQCKLILIACNTASAAAYQFIKTSVDDRCIVMNVIDPVIDYLKLNQQYKNIGLIGTRQTVHSEIFNKKLAALNLNCQLKPYPTNLLASAIEEFGDHPVIDALLEVYLTQPSLQNIDSLILACTHYPIIKHKISKFYRDTITIIDPSEIVAKAVVKQLTAKELLNEQGHGHKHFYVSDYTESFAKHAAYFFTENIRLEHFPLKDFKTLETV